MQKRLTVVLVGAAVAAICTLSAAAQTQSPDPWIGTWKVNLEKSTYSPGPPPTVAPTIKLEPSGAGMKVTIDGTDPKGQPIHNETVGAFDGKDNPVKGGAVPNMTTAFKRVDSRTFEGMGKVDGKPTVTTRVVISADGKTMTATQTGRNAQGDSVNNVIVAIKQ